MTTRIFDFIVGNAAMTGYAFGFGLVLGGVFQPEYEFTWAFSFAAVVVLALFVDFLRERFA